MAQPAEFPHELPPEQTIEGVLADPAASFWLKNALRSALQRDPVDAANDAEVLAKLLDKRCRRLLTADANQTK